MSAQPTLPVRMTMAAALASRPEVGSSCAHSEPISYMAGVTKHTINAVSGLLQPPATFLEMRKGDSNAPHMAYNMCESLHNSTCACKSSAGNEGDGRPHHEDDGGVGDQLNGNGQALALLHAEPADAWLAHYAVGQALKLHQLHHLGTPATTQSVSCCMRSVALT